RTGLVAKLRFAVSLLGSVLHARRLLRQHRADFVLGVGGYISAPPVLAAWTLGIPRAIHEANVTPGAANRLCARVADFVLLTYETTGPRLPGRAPRHVVGCPTNPAVSEGDRSAALARYRLSGDRPVLLVVGGSLGAQTINDLGIALARVPSRTFDMVLVTGPKYFEQTSKALEPPPPGVAIIDYEDRMPEAYAAADLALCRAGSSTLAELTAVGLASVLVPSPNVTDNHQEGNARGLEAVGAAEVLVENGLDIDDAVAAIAALLGDRNRLDAMSRAARAQYKGDTAGQVADLIEDRLR
ncbi:MAG: UDP-N-acetylglucosamine--N-acetylmuramyl-(pentapeptide) pyrophosphoryl-undecaprenol N-acetylglucosamine transferase, partial [Myxococcota bacterium]|nr:UDP-N-acetylglucosamine--N-acetylmuramyl-(pentapeptide) pyrophosphoryl-undecaprenol N-acetylglucosamine transferase [Myxococcota bacterium]MEC8423503.1 UDP-N-acetylglucosamine--N-acetylmuramyl-(pentapeptide) pyrophosphoryl-undecaprenol N-acetylglucosamine transferase [Myxococcota bacterium]